MNFQRKSCKELTEPILDDDWEENAQS
uniref:Uncharacterized protein n=1 Tax=Rhizophora mucronata TaxID=61149 RepID=A0A2P2NEC9_RHIMU